MKNKIAFLSGSLLALTSLSHGAISWQTPQSITDASDVITTGDFVHAHNFSSLNATVNGVVFTAYNYNPGTQQTSTQLAGAFTFARLSPSTHIGSTLFTTGATGDGGPYGALRASGAENLAYSNLFIRALAGQGGSGGAAPNNYNAYTFTLEGLVAGNEYLVQLWFADGRDSDNSRNGQGYLDGTTLVDYNSATSGIGGLGQHVTGTFVAEGNTQSFTFQVDPGTSTSAAFLNAYQVRIIPEPSAALLGIFGLSTFALRHRR